MLDRNILLLHDNIHIQRTFLHILRETGIYGVRTVTNIMEARGIYKLSNYKLLIAKFKLPDGSAISLLEDLKEKISHSILIVEDKEFQQSISKLSNNNCYFLRESFQKDELIGILEKIRKSDSEEKNLSLNKSKERYELDFREFVGDSEVILNIFDLVNRVADTNATVLITGDSGTGKEILAKTLHYNSHRRNEPFVPVNCGAIPAGLLESELFGHTRGAFTSAIAKKDGRFKLANKGTLFLDEIGVMNPDLQIKLLRVLQTKSFEPIGSVKSIKIDTRIIAATNIDMEKAIVEKAFREDLFYRLNVIPISIPSLKERKSDIPLLVQHFLKIFNKEQKCDVHISDERVMNALMNYTWPGNVRELENIIQRLVILKQVGLISLEDLPERFFDTKNTFNNQSYEFLNFRLPEEGISLKEMLSKFENNLLKQALKKSNGNKNKASELLKMNRTTLVEKLKRNNL